MGTREKINTFVEAPHMLDLQRWIAGPILDGGASYTLHAVVNHSGSLSFGHYTACCKLGAGTDRQWYRLNDSVVTLASEGAVVSNEAYMLFYERASSDTGGLPSDSCTASATGY